MYKNNSNLAKGENNEEDSYDATYDCADIDIPDSMCSPTATCDENGA
jgi:hypothetical protein